MNDEILRIYHFSDAVMLIHVKAAIGYLEKDLPEFTAFDETINPKYLAAFKTQLAAAEEDVSDDVIIDRQVQLTNEANKNLEESVRLVTDITYFIDKAFESKAIRNEFGLNHFIEAKKAKGKMILFLRDFSKVAQKYKAQLEGAGCKPEMIADIDILYKKLDDSSRQSELFKGNRPVITQERIIKYNELWTKALGIAAAAKIIYRDNLAKQKRYLTPKRTSRDYSVKVAANTQLVAINNGLESNSFLEIKNTGQSVLVFFVADTDEAAIPQNAITVAAGETETVKAKTISNGTYGQLIVANQTDVESAFKAHELE